MIVLSPKFTSCAFRPTHHDHSNTDQPRILVPVSSRHWKSGVPDTSPGRASTAILTALAWNRELDRRGPGSDARPSKVAVSRTRAGSSTTISAFMPG